MLLEVQGLVAGYGNKQVVHNISINISEGEIVALFGHNGAGKSTTLSVIFGMLPARKGKVIFNGKDITNRNTIVNVKDGISLVPQGRGIFSELNVLENLKLGAYTLGKEVDFNKRLEEVYSLFPILKERKSQMAGLMSGGEQQMLALGINLIREPKLLMLDEPSLGLAPVLVERVMDSVKHINQRYGTGILLVEQNLGQALHIATRAYVMKMGAIVLDESVEKLKARGSYWDLF